MSGGCPANHTVTKCPSSMSRSRFRPFVLWNLPSRTSCGPASVLESGGLGRGAHDKETQEAAPVTVKTLTAAPLPCGLEHLCNTGSLLRYPLWPCWEGGYSFLGGC